MKENSIEETIKIIERKIKEAEHYSNITGLCLTLDEELRNALMNILSDYKRVLKENERYQKSDYETICLENNELREITDRIQSEYNDLLKDNFKLKDELEAKRKEYQETYKDVREELRELKKENKELKEEKDADYTTVYLKGIYNERERWELKVKGNIKNYRKLADEAYKNFQKSNRKDRDLRDTGLYFDGHVSALEKIL